MSGKPRQMYVDNAAEFKSEALRRGCDQHGIGLRYRPPGQPHFGGIVERLIGTMMELVHDEVPGTTFSNTAQRGDYNSDGKAVLPNGCPTHRSPTRTGRRSRGWWCRCPPSRR
jgi:putative transposase